MSVLELKNEIFCVAHTGDIDVFIIFLLSSMNEKAEAVIFPL
jgi:hypothetical protein